MLFAFIDECNPEPDRAEGQPGRFLVFGAIMVSSTNAKSLTDELQAIREHYGFLNEDSLKFALADKPKNISKEFHQEAKIQAIRAAIRHEVKCIIYFALHKIIDSQGMDTYLSWAVDACFTKIQQFYTENQLDEGFMVFVDRHSRSSQGKHLSSKFIQRNKQSKDGFNTPDLISVSSAWDGTSHLASLCDIITGSFSYIINNPTRDIAGKALIKELRPLVWGKKEGKIYRVVDRGLLFRPKDQFPKFKEIYEETQQRIISWANDDYHD